MNQFYDQSTQMQAMWQYEQSQEEEVEKAVKALGDFADAMNKLDSKHQQRVLNEGIKAEILKSILKMQ